VLWLCFFFFWLEAENCLCFGVFFFFKQKTAYEMVGSDWSSDVCSSDLLLLNAPAASVQRAQALRAHEGPGRLGAGGGTRREQQHARHGIPEVAQTAVVLADRVRLVLRYALGRSLLVPFVPAHVAQGRQPLNRLQVLPLQG